MYCGRFVGPSLTAHGWSPCRSFTSIQTLHTHTPGRSRVNPAGAGSTLKGKRKRKSGHKRRANSAGEEGSKRTSRTNLHGETDLTNTEHTPKPHNTLQRGTGEKLGTEWWTSWWRKEKQQIQQIQQIDIKGLQFDPREPCVTPKTGPMSFRPHGHKTGVQVQLN